MDESIFKLGICLILLVILLYFGKADGRKGDYVIVWNDNSRDTLMMTRYASRFARTQISKKKGDAYLFVTDVRKIEEK